MSGPMSGPRPATCVVSGGTAPDGCRYTNHSFDAVGHFLGEGWGGVIGLVMHELMFGIELLGSMGELN